MALISACLTVFLAATTTYAQEPSWEQRENLPRWARSRLGSQTFSRSFTLSTHINPFLVQGDFNGDASLDLAVLVKNKSTGEIGIAIVHAGTESPFILGAGNSVGAGGRDFGWMDAWQVYSRSLVGRGTGPEAPPKLRGDALLVMKLESASGIIYWSGDSYQWYQQGD